MPLHQGQEPMLHSVSINSIHNVHKAEPLTVGSKGDQTQGDNDKPGAGEGSKKGESTGRS